VSEDINGVGKGSGNGGEQFLFEGALLAPLVVPDVDRPYALYHPYERLLEVSRIHRRTLGHGIRHSDLFS
jgi:hypothetical protein